MINMNKESERITIENANQKQKKKILNLFINIITFFFVCYILVLQFIST